MVNIVTRLQAELRNILIPGRYRGFFSTPKHPDWPYRKADFSPSFTAKVKSAWSCTSTPLYIFMLCTK
jgi:hypothetical protein